MAVRTMGGYGGDIKPMHIQDMETNAHYDKIPIPQGSWEENYKKKNAGYNMQLLASTAALIATVVVVSYCFIFCGLDLKS